jgi:hypothetical protein
MNPRIALGVVLLALMFWGWQLALAAPLPGTPTGTMPDGKLPAMVTLTAPTDESKGVSVTMVNFPVTPGDLVLLEMGEDQKAPFTPAKKKQWSDVVRFSTQTSAAVITLNSDTPENTGFASITLDSNNKFMPEKTGDKGFKEPPNEADAKDVMNEYKITFKLPGDAKDRTIIYMIPSDLRPNLNPEPSTITLLGLGSLALLAYGRRRKRAT